jgi:TetR/AcrR family transcriptional regulator
MWLDPLLALDPEAEPRDALTRYIATKLEYSRTYPEASRLFAMEMLQGAPHLKKALATTLASIVADKKATIESWITRGKLRPVAPHHLIFAMWAMTQHYADFAAQIDAITGRGLGDEAFFRETQAEIAGLILEGVLPRE